MSFQNIAIVGAAGNIGRPLVQALISSAHPKFNVTALIRPSSAYEPPNGAESEQLKATKVDFDNHDELVKALEGHDAVIISITSNHTLAPTSQKLIDASIEAGVKLFIPSDFGVDDSAARDQLFPGKKAVREYLGKVSAENKISYCFVRNGSLMDTTLKFALGMDLVARKATIYDGGQRKAHISTSDSVGHAVVSILSNPAPYMNKFVHIHDFFINQQELLLAAEAVVGGKFETEDVDVEALGRHAIEKLGKQGFSFDVLAGILINSTWGVGNDARWDEADDSLNLGLGNKVLNEELKRMFAKVQ